MVHEIICPPARRTGPHASGSAPFLSLNKADLGIALSLLNSLSLYSKLSQNSLDHGSLF